MLTRVVTSALGIPSPTPAVPGASIHCTSSPRTNVDPRTRSVPTPPSPGPADRFAVALSPNGFLGRDPTGDGGLSVQNAISDPDMGRPRVASLAHPALSGIRNPHALDHLCAGK